MIRTLAICAVVAALLLPGGGAVAEESGTLAPVIPPAMGARCVEPSDVMRVRHMRFLMHQRDDTVHSGVRGARHSLVGCIGCHVQSNTAGVAIPVNAKGQFCESCHAFAGVRMDCFECHATVPGKLGARTALPAWMSSPIVRMAGAVSSAAR